MSRSTNRGIKWLQVLFSKLEGKTNAYHKPKLTESDLINAESAIGATIFGPIPDGHRREFFRYGHNVWIFHESWTEPKENNSEKLVEKESTIRYEVRENGVYKLPLGHPQYIKLRDKELENFRSATREYVRLVKEKLY